MGLESAHRRRNKVRRTRWCLAWPATEYISENNSVATSSGARPWRPPEGTRREARRRAGSGEASRPGAPLLGVRHRAHGREQGRNREVGHAGMAEARDVHARRPRRQAVEQVAGTGVDMVECRFRLVTGRFVPWAQNEVFCTRPALHFSLRDQGH